MREHKKTAGKSRTGVWHDLEKANLHFMVNDPLAFQQNWLKYTEQKVYEMPAKTYYSFSFTLRQKTS